MKSIQFSSALRIAIGMALCGALMTASAQTPGSAKGKIDAKAADKSATARRLADGHPNFSGVWIPDAPGMIQARRLPDGSIPCVVGCPPPATGAEKSDAKAAEAPPRPSRTPQKPKYKAEYVAKVQDLSERQVKTDPALRCGNPGLPRIGAPDQIVQIPGQVIFLYSDLFGAAFRVIPTDGRPHRVDAEETYLGESVGKWEGDTLVIEAMKFIEDTWLIDNGAFHTSNLKVVERVKFNGNKLEYQATAYDPEVLAEPWEMRTRTLKMSDKPLNEPIPCVETDLDHMVDSSHHDNAR